MPDAATSVTDEIRERIAEVRRVSRDDRLAALYLCAYHSKRAEILDEPMRSDTLASLAPFAAHATAEDIAEARRYAEVRAHVADLQRRLASLPRVAEQRLLDRVVSAGKNAEMARYAQVGALGVGLLLMVAGCALPRALGGIAFVIGFFLLVGARLLGVVARAMAADAAQAAEAAADATGAAQMRREMEVSYREVLDGPHGAWLRELVAAHPALTVPGLQRS